MTDSENKIRQVIGDPETSTWLRQGLTSALRRDPADARADADTLQWLLEWRWDEICKRGATT